MATDEEQIRQLLATQQQAVCAKDVDRIMAHYAEDVIVFNVKPPFQIRGANEWRRAWETSLSHFPPSFGNEMKDLAITLSGDLAIAHFLYRFTGLGEQSWIRDTAVYRRNQGSWRIVHEHFSVPFDPETSRVVLDLEP
jgi:ketosteroid isomerase-like protein